jgi:DnaD/phage-associated family protein
LGLTALPSNGRLRLRRSGIDVVTGGVSRRNAPLVRWTKVKLLSVKQYIKISGAARMEFKFDLGLFGGVFAVPNAIADEHIKIAGAAHLKVLLYCLRHSGQSLTAGEISRATGVAESEVEPALEFWQQRGLSNPPANAAPASDTAQSAQSSDKTADALLNADYDFPPTEIAELLENDKNIAYLFKRAEDLYGRTLRPHENNALSVIVAEVGIKPEVALTLLEYCFTIGKTSAHYLKNVAKDWYKQNIDSFETATAHAQELKEFRDIENEFTRLLEIKAIPDARKPLFKKWMTDFSFTPEIIYAAYQESLEGTGKLTYNYMDKVLTGWHQNGVGAKNPNKPKITKSTTKSKTQDSASPSSFDLDELDKQIMEEYKGFK